MKKFRIRIEIQKDGKKWYRPQECTFSFLGVWLSWNSLDKYGYRNSSGSYFLEISEAETAIVYRKQLDIDNENEKITRIEYKHL